MIRSKVARVIAVALMGSIVGISPASADSTILGRVPGQPYGITIDSAGNIYTANINSNNVSKITPDGISSILGTTGLFPAGITIDSAGNIYTANNASNNVSKITPDGISSILGTTGRFPSGITIDSAGNIYTVNFGFNNVSKITPAGTSSILGTTGVGPIGITIDSAGNIYTANIDSNNVSKITPDGISSIFGTTGAGPNAITIDSAGNIYTANRYDNNVTKINRPVSAVELAAAKAASELADQRAAETKREAEKQAARAEVTNSVKTYKDVNLELFTRAEIPGVTAANIAAVQAEIAALPQTSRADLNQVLKIARKYEVVGKIASDQFTSIHSDSLIEIGLIPQESKQKAAITAAIKKLPLSDRSSYASIKTAIDAEMAEIQNRKDRLAKVITRNASRYTK